LLAAVPLKPSPADADDQKPSGPNPNFYKNWGVASYQALATLLFLEAIQLLLKGGRVVWSNQ